MLRITLIGSDQAGVSVMIAEDHAPAFRAALNELRTTLGQRLKDAHLYVREDALTHAVIAIGALAAAVNHIVPKDDPNYV